LDSALIEFEKCVEKVAKNARNCSKIQLICHTYLTCSAQGEEWDSQYQSMYGHRGFQWDEVNISHATGSRYNILKLYPGSHTAGAGKINFRS